MFLSSRPGNKKFRLLTTRMLCTTVHKRLLTFLVKYFLCHNYAYSVCLVTQTQQSPCPTPLFPLMYTIFLAHTPFTMDRAYPSPQHYFIISLLLLLTDSSIDRKNPNMRKSKQVCCIAVYNYRLLCLQ